MHLATQNYSNNVVCCFPEYLLDQYLMIVKINELSFRMNMANV